MDCESLWTIFKSSDVDFFTGLPDSTFKDWMVFLDRKHDNYLTNIIACNECEAVAIASGYHLSSQKLPVVYLQNAGEGKTVNPLTSLCDPEVYSIPMLLMIGWRGRPSENDEPQHSKMGKITLPLLDVLDIPYKILTVNLEDSQKDITFLINLAMTEKRPVALIVPRGIISDPNYQQEGIAHPSLFREEAIHTIMKAFSGSEVIISTTGKTSRELFEYRVSQGETPHDFYTVGAMGCAPAIALGIALDNPSKRVVVFDGDGALLMQMGSLSTIGHYQPNNLYHIVFDNQAYDSTGGQPTVSGTTFLADVANACGYATTQKVSTVDELSRAVNNIFTFKGPYFLVVKVDRGSRDNLSRPTTSPIQNKIAFMKHLQE